MFCVAILGLGEINGRNEMGTNREREAMALDGREESGWLRQTRGLEERPRDGRRAAGGRLFDVPTGMEVLEEPVSVVPEPTPGSVEAIVCAYPWSCETALRIVRCESNFRADAVGAGSYGLFQIQASYHAHKWADFWNSWADPVRNTEYAWSIYQRRGWAAWSCW